MERARTAQQEIAKQEALLAEQVNESAAMAAGELLRAQKAADEAATVAARQERIKKSEAVFKGDAGLADGQGWYRHGKDDEW